MSAVMVSLDGPSVFDDMPSAVYHADPAPEPSLSSGIAKILVTQSPLHAMYAHPRLNPTYRSEESSEFDRGSAAHALLLEGEDRMVECEFNDWRTNAAKEMRDQARIDGKLPLLSKHVGAVRAMVHIAKDALLASELQIDIADCYAERSVIWSAGGIWGRARFDLQHRTRRILIDYKTTENADPQSFARQIISLGYDVQAAHYVEAYEAAWQAEPTFVFLVQEREPPYACSLVGVDPMMLELGQQKLEFAAKLWKQCITSGKWPGYSTRIAWAAPPAWALESFEMRRSMSE
jgi:hypothetical protein